MKILEKRNYTIVGKPMFNKEFVRFVKKSERSGMVDFDKGIEIMEERLEKHRNMKE